MAVGITSPHFAYERPRTDTLFFQGSLLRDQRDATGTLYRRNRVCDSASGRLTQEDPIGLASGLNSCGFAGGDPVNFGDPFGLCPERSGGDGRHRTLGDCPLGQRGGPSSIDDPAERRFRWTIPFCKLSAGSKCEACELSVGQSPVLRSMALIRRSRVKESEFPLGRFWTR